jgi:hypothetical protein
MRVSFNPQSGNNYNQNFQMRLVEDASLERYINSFHFKKQQDNLKQAITIIKDYVQNNPENKNLLIGALHPSKANYVKNGTYDEFFILPKSRFKKTSDRFERENIYMQFDGTDKVQGFYMNPDENPTNLANWFMNTLNYYKKSLTKKS